MKAILIKNINVKTAIAYLIFEKEQQRPDIVKFLNGEEFENETINKRVKEYLTKLHILNEDGSLTKKGHKILETGKLFFREEGKYKIWFVEQDNFLWTRILFFERKSPRENERINGIDVSFEKENFFLPINDEKFSSLKLVNTNEIYGQITNHTDKIELIWEWDNLEKSSYHFVGKIDKNTIEEHKIECNKNLEEYILRIFPDWDYVNQKLKIYNSLLNDNEKRKFKTNYQNKNQAGFDEIKFTDIPIMPYDKQDAVKWRNWLINQEIEKEYFLKYDFEKLVKEINDKDGFSAYKNDLNIPSISTYRNEIYNKDSSKQSPSFWHLSAPDDLNPDIKQGYIIKFIDYEINAEISFEKIVKKLVENTKNNINSVFYYDKYTYTNNQQKNMVAFFEAFSNVKNKFLITNTKLEKRKRSNYLKNNNTGIVEIDLNDVFGKKNKQQHNRYIILAESKNKYTVWQLPSSIDYIKFEDNDVNPETFGVIKDSISFNQVKKEMLKQELRNFTESKL